VNKYRPGCGLLFVHEFDPVDVTSATRHAPAMGDLDWAESVDGTSTNVSKTAICFSMKTSKGAFYGSTPAGSNAQRSLAPRNYRGFLAPFARRTHSEPAILFGRVSVKTCSVSLNDPQGVKHTVDVTADSLFEAAATALAIFKKNGWTDSVGSAALLEVEVREPPVKHTVTVRRFSDGYRAQPRVPMSG